MCTNAKNLHYSIKGTLYVCENWNVVKNNNEFLHKLAEEQELNPEEMIYNDIISQNKPRYGDAKNWILIQDSDTKQKWYLFTKEK